MRPPNSPELYPAENCLPRLLILLLGEVPYRLNVDFELIALSSVADMVLQTYALGKFVG